MRILFSFVTTNGGCRERQEDVSLLLEKKQKTSVFLHTKIGHFEKKKPYDITNKPYKFLNFRNLWMYVSN